jgi:hypothetical protein
MNETIDLVSEFRLHFLVSIACLPLNPARKKDQFAFVVDQVQMILKPAELVLLSFYLLFLVVALSFALLAFCRINIYSTSPDSNQNYGGAFTEFIPGHRNYIDLNSDTYISFIARNRSRFQKNMAQKQQLESGIQRSLTASAEDLSDRTQSTILADPISSVASIKYPESKILLWPPSSPLRASIRFEKEKIDHRFTSFAMR